MDFIYAGPQMTRVPRTFNSAAREQAFANMGLLLFVVDARGTPSRGKAFQDLVYHNMGRNEIPDHVAVLKQLAVGMPYVDLTRAGIIGGSSGGYFTVRAMLTAPEIYSVGVALAPVYELDYNGAEVYMGTPKGNPEGYEYGSNLRQASNLQGRLLIVHGTSDLNAPFGGTIRMIEALERANKPYDLVLLPEMDHTGQNSAYSLQSVRRYLVEHLKP